MLVVLVQATEAPPWDCLRQDQLATWVRESSVPTHHYFGRRSRLISATDVLHERLRWSRSMGRPLAAADRLLQAPLQRGSIPRVELLPDGALNVLIPDLYLTGGLKFLGALAWVREAYDPQWVYRTTVSSYVNVPGLTTFVQGLGPDVDWAGTQVPHPKGAFASGTNVLLSRKLVDQLLAHPQQWPHRYLEDVALGVILRRNATLLKHIPSLWIHSPEEVDRLTSRDLHDFWHFRCRSADERGARLDGEIMRRLAERYRRLSDVQ